MRINTPDLQLTADTDDGFIVATVERDDRFSIMAEMYPSRRAWELGNDSVCFACGQLTDKVAAAFPQLAPISAMHLCDVKTGEPMHAVANTLYWIKNDDYPAAARSLHVSEDELREVWARASSTPCSDEWSTWIDDTLRPRWYEMARLARETIHSLKSESTASEEVEDGDEYLLDLDAGLKVSARLLDSTGHREGVGDYYRYAVTVTDGSHIYEAEFGGSVHDYSLGRVSAREAALGTLHELVSVYQFNTARGFIEDELGEDWDELPADQREAMKRAESAYNAMEAALSANADTIGG